MTGPVPSSDEDSPFLIAVATVRSFEDVAVIGHRQGLNVSAGIVGGNGLGVEIWRRDIRRELIVVGQKLISELRQSRREHGVRVGTCGSYQHCRHWQE